MINEIMTTPERAPRSQSPRWLIGAALALATSVIVVYLLIKDAPPAVASSELAEDLSYAIRCDSCNAEYELPAHEYADLVAAGTSNGGVQCAHCGAASAWRKTRHQIPEQMPGEDELAYEKRVWGLAEADTPNEDTEFGRRVFHGEFDEKSGTTP